MNISTTQTFQRLIDTMRLLERQGVRFWVQTSDGMEFRSTVLPGGSGHTRTKVDRGGVRLIDIFGSRLTEMKVGDFEVFEMPNNVKNLDQESWKSAITSTCVRVFGKGNYTTSSVPSTGAVEVLRIK